MTRPPGFGAWLLRPGVAVLLVAVAVARARRMPVGWPPRPDRGRRIRPRRLRVGSGTGPGAHAGTATGQAAMPGELESRLQWVRLAMADPAQFSAALVDWLLAVADGTARGRPRLFDMGADPAVRQARAAEVLGSAGLELARGLPPTVDRIRASADAIRRRWEG